MIPEFVRSIASRAFNSTGVTNSAGGVVKSFVSSSNDGGSSSDYNNAINDIFINVDRLKPVLRKYPLVTLILEIYKSSILEILGSNYDVVIKGKPELTKKVNEYLKSIEIDKFIKDNLEDALYEGSYSSSIMNITEDNPNLDTNPKNYRRVGLIDPVSLIKCVTNGSKSKIRYLANAPSDRLNVFDETSKVLSSKSIIYLAFNPIIIKRVNLGNKKKSDSLVNGLPEINTDDIDYLKSVRVDIEYLTGKGILDELLPLIFEHMLKYTMSLLLSVKNSIRPDVLIARLNSKAYDLNEAPAAIQDIEALLNNGENTVDFRFSDPSSIINMIYQAILNSVKVVPGLQNYSEFELLQYPDITEKLAKLAEDLERLRQQITNNSAIPQELIDGGGANRWESIQRSSRFLTHIKNYIDDIKRCVVQVAYEYVVSLNLESDILLSDIDLNIDDSNVLFNSETTSKASVLSEKLRSIDDIFRTAKNIRDDEVVDKEKFNEWIKDKLKSLDPSTSEFIDLRKSNSESDESPESIPPWMR